MAKLFKTDGTTIEVHPKNGTDYTLDELQQMLGGYIEIVPAYKDGYILVVDEDGEAKGLPRNGRATDLADINLWDYIKGDALYCKTDEIK